MQIDFHYYCIFVLANLAGYSKEDAKIIAYSSQYTDDATDSTPVYIGEFVFDTVRTAHMGLRAKRWSVNKKVHIPFHFIPPRPVDGLETFTYITQPDSLFARMLFDDASKEKSDLFLYRLGIAIHTLSDTWAHQNFSGRKHRENNLVKIRRSKKEHPLRCPLWWYPPNWITDAIALRVGHSQALKYPDHSHGYWGYKKRRQPENCRHNDTEVMKAAEVILFRLGDLLHNKDIEPVWEKNKEKIHHLFLHKKYSSNKMLMEKCRQWQAQYPDFFTDERYRYNEHEWRDTAMDVLKEKDIQKFRDTNWAKFHQAALKQRYFVLQHIT